MSSFVVGDKKKEFSFEFFKYEWKYLDILGILLTRFVATDVKNLSKRFEIVRSSVIVSIFRLILLEDFSFFTLIGLASTRSVLLVIIGWLVTQFSQKRLKGFF